MNASTRVGQAIIGASTPSANENAAAGNNANIHGPNSGVNAAGMTISGNGNHVGNITHGAPVHHGDVKNVIGVQINDPVSAIA
ncbi:hypothetical protein SDRG_16166 [Saprolegnia diclina VS20]|uniref:Uncharacterized protein n=1 Tax=Saprolegnia diclina (strain VS20) TaxID=1156394 RepID=T0R1W2_SAPDV|nr:hypothetical protein SDRG_16166 [Saprolegnia diclina VS20]EQC25978.1 hypothetical protein SDRG_16166 [Saprolegnia diclina VS20]|eukprot:XP_008620587.1 hypothetical protein SDRG_16166 [Saprolegnia diclina VS20]